METASKAAIPNANQLVPTGDDGAFVPALSPEQELSTLLTGDKRTMICNYDGTPEQLAGFMSYCQSSSVKTSAAFINEEIAIRWFFIHSVRINGETDGEIIDTFRTVIVDGDRNAIAFVSEGILASIEQLVAAYGMGPFDPPLKVVLRQIDLKGGRSMFRLESTKFDF